MPCLASSMPLRCSSNCLAGDRPVTGGSNDQIPVSLSGFKIALLLSNRRSKLAFPAVGFAGQSSEKHLQVWTRAIPRQKMLVLQASQKDPCEGIFLIQALFR
ncbi:hypothetical protein E2562_031674 [Oryza meyeriana var. granulata]|uniref:Uncharacterized protein n=1 Tax=Oryza meyeriana var. granulata TaxID=110450 RepID=A0A6G1E5W0_9ORYZ|nr:hypothetical protein E2562_031674 [Oryza meyeriana var. granulata]